MHLHWLTRFRDNSSFFGKKVVPFYDKKKTIFKLINFEPMKSQKNGFSLTI